MKAFKNKKTFYNKTNIKKGHIQNPIVNTIYFKIIKEKETALEENSPYGREYFNI